MLKTVTNIAREAGKILLKYHRKDLEIRFKRDEHDPVTQADIEADRFIRKRLQEEFPSLLILSEETTEIPLNYSSNVWMVDPLDGTNEFIQKKDGFSVNIGLCKNGIPALGVVYCPLRDELYYAEAGKGAYLQKKGQLQKLKVSKVNSISKSMAVLIQSDAGDKSLDQIVDLKVRENASGDSAAMKIMGIAGGKIDFYVDTAYKASKWDTCAAQVILEEAGGKITDLFGNRLDYKDKKPILKNSFVASNKIIHAKIINEIKKYL